MTTTATLRSLRLIGRTDFTRLTGSRGEIFYDSVNNTLRVFDSVQTGGVSLAKADLTNISNSAFAAKAATAGVGGGSGEDRCCGILRLLRRDTRHGSASVAFSHKRAELDPCRALRSGDATGSFPALG